MRILITGGNGFVGMPIVRKLLDAEHEILALARAPLDAEPRPNHKSIKWIHSSLQLTPSALAEIQNFKPEVVIHLAWNNIPDFSFETSLENMQQSILFLKNILNIGSVKKLVAAGSCLEYGNKFGSCNELDLCMPTSYFAFAKNAIRDFLQVECFSRNVDLAWLRVFYVYGPRQREASLIPTLIRNIKNQTTLELKNPKNSNDFIFVDDLADCFIEIVEKKIQSGIYNIGSGHAVPILEVLKLVEKILRNEQNVSDQILQKSMTIVKELDFWADMNKTFAMLTWRARTTLEEGIKKTINTS